MTSDITVVITTVAPRRDLLKRALRSVADSTLTPDAIVVEEDVQRLGAAVTRESGTERVETSRVAYLDDDDEFEQLHLQRCAEVMDATGADLVFPWFTVIGPDGHPRPEWDPFPMHFGKPWDNAEPRQVPVTFLAKVDAIREAGGWLDDWNTATAEDPGTDGDGNRAGEDFRLVCRMVDHDMRIVHLAERTWRWWHWGGNASGLPSRIPWGQQ